MLCSGMQYNTPHFQINPEMVDKIFETFYEDFTSLHILP